MPIIPPLFDNGELVTDYQCKADIFNNYFASQCTPLDNFDGVPELPQRTHLLLSKSRKKKSLDPNKSNGWDKISTHMIKICDSAIVPALQFIFESCIR